MTLQITPQIACPRCGHIGWSGCSSGLSCGWIDSMNESVRNDWIVYVLTEAGKRGLKFSEKESVPMTGALANKIAEALAKTSP